MAEIKVIYEELEFETLIEDLVELPENIRPMYFAENEGVIKDKTKDLISNTARFKEFVDSHGFGFFLYSKDRTGIDFSCNMPSRGLKQISIGLKKKYDHEVIQSIFRIFAKHKPLFGYAAEWDEYLHRNRVSKNFKSMSVESWIGRSVKSYLPGLYWFTLLSHNIIEKHQIRLDEIADEAIGIEELEDNACYLMCFFDEASNWKEHAERIDCLCERAHGVFSRRHIDDAIRNLDNYSEYDQIVSKWF